MATGKVETKNPASSIRLLRLLLLEHDSSEAANILRELKDLGLEMAPCHAADAVEFRKALNSGKFDVIICAWALADVDGQEALRALRKNHGDTPLVLITGESEEKAAEDCGRCGAVDYVSRDRLARLPFALKRAVAEHRLAGEVARLRASREEYETPVSELIEHSVYGIFRVAPDGTFHTANDTLLKILGCSQFSDLQAMNLATDVFRYADAFTKLLADSREHAIVHNMEPEWRRWARALVHWGLTLRGSATPAAM